MADLYDVDGNIIEGALTPDEVAEIKAQAEEATVYKEKLAETEERLKGLETKDFNWRKFEEAAEEEKKKMLNGFSEKEQQIMKDKAEIMAKMERLEGTIYQKDKDSILTSIAGNDVELRAKIEEAAKKFAGTPTTVEEWQERYIEATTLIQGFRPKINPLNRFSPAVEYRSEANSGKYTDTDRGKQNFKNWFKVDLQ